MPRGGEGKLPVSPIRGCSSGEGDCEEEGIIPGTPATRGLQWTMRGTIVALLDSLPPLISDRHKKKSLNLQSRRNEKEKDKKEEEMPWRRRRRTNVEIRDARQTKGQKNSRERKRKEGPLREEQCFSPPHRRRRGHGIPHGGGVQVQCHCLRVNPLPFRAVLAR